MAEKDQPYTRLTLPLTPGAIVPADAGRFRGVAFEVRGEGEYRLAATAYGVREGGPFSAPFQAGGKWRLVRIPFDRMRQARTEAGPSLPSAALLSLSFELARPASQPGWLELDNIRFYR
jgi:hypothetical protein